MQRKFWRIVSEIYSHTDRPTVHRHTHYNILLFCVGKLTSVREKYVTFGGFAALCDKPNGQSHTDNNDNHEYDYHGDYNGHISG